MLTSLLGQTCTILTPSQRTNGFRTTVDDWSNPTTSTHPCRLQHVSGVERTDNRSLAIGRWKLFLPPEATVTEQHRVQVDGKTFDVIAVYPVHRPAGLHHYEVELETYSGEVPSGQ